jgi:hypothetical protein
VLLIRPSAIVLEIIPLKNIRSDTSSRIDEYPVVYEIGELAVNVASFGEQNLAFIYCLTET